MVEHQLPKLAFAGSIPVSRSIRKCAAALVAAFSFRRGKAFFTLTKRKSRRCNAPAN